MKIIGHFDWIWDNKRYWKSIRMGHLGNGFERSQSCTPCLLFSIQSIGLLRGTSTSYNKTLLQKIHVSVLWLSGYLRDQTWDLQNISRVHFWTWDDEVHWHHAKWGRSNTSAVARVRCTIKVKYLIRPIYLFYPQASTNAKWVSQKNQHGLWEKHFIIK